MRSELPANPVKGLEDGYGLLQGYVGRFGRTLGDSPGRLRHFVAESRCGCSDVKLPGALYRAIQ